MLRSLLLSVLPCCAALALSAQSGTLDPTYGTNGIASMDMPEVHDAARALMLQPDGKTVVAGCMTTTDNMAFLLARFTADGALDPAFGSGGWVVADHDLVDQYWCAALQPDGRIVAAGTTGDLSGHDHIVVSRYLADGALDIDFGTNGHRVLELSERDDCYALSIQDNGNIVLAGNSQVAGASCGNIVRLLPDGSMDEQFGEGGSLIVDSAPSYSFGAVHAFADGRVLVAGHRQGAFDLATIVGRFLPDGSLDQTYGVNGWTVLEIPSIRTIILGMEVLDDGTTLCSGYADDDGEQTFLWKLTPSGAADPTLGTDGIAILAIPDQQAHLRDLTVLADGSIIAYGGVRNSENQRQGLVLATLPDGTPDPGFSEDGWALYGIGTDAEVRGGTVMEDGRILITGWTYAEGQRDLFVARIHGVSGVGISERPTSKVVWIFPDPADGLVNVVDAEMRMLELFDGNGKRVLVTRSVSGPIDIQALPCGMYHVRTYGDDRGVVGRGRFVKR